MNCGKCGNTLSGDTKFCNKCGTATKGDNKSSDIQDKKVGTKPILGGVISLIVFVAAFAGVRYLGHEGFNAVSGNNSKQETIRQAVLQTKNQTTFPTELDAATTWTDILEEPGAIRYEYTLHDIDISHINNEVLKNFLTPSLCGNKDTRNILDAGINMEYHYQVRGAAENFFISVSKADCS